MSDPQINTTDARFRHWRKSSRSGNEGTCVYLSPALDGSLVGIADSKAGPDAPVLVCSAAAVRGLVAAVKVGQLAA